MRVGMLLGLGVTSLLSVCCQRSDPPYNFSEAADTAEQLALPPDARTLATSPPKRSDWAATAGCEFETSWDWPTYSAWVEGRLHSSFETVDIGAQRIRAVKRLPGDLFVLQIDAVAHTPVLRVRATYTASAE